jgi:diadenosine tetraphosphate (Ap4A) HIT family hydrolase
MTDTSPSQTTAYVDLDNARVDEQRAVMKEIIAQKHCPFCLENLFTYHKKPVIKEGQYWIITENQWPYDFTKEHLLAIHKDHAETLQELTPEAGAELFRFLRELESEHHFPGGGVAMRFGDTNYSAGTVNHIHAQIFVPDIENPDFKPVKIKLGKEAAKRQEPLG